MKELQPTLSVINETANDVHYVYAADGYGILRCVDTDTMRSVWAFDTGDNTDAAIALDLRNNGLDLYTGTTAFSRSALYSASVMAGLAAFFGASCGRM